MQYTFSYSYQHTDYHQTHETVMVPCLRGCVSAQGGLEYKMKSLLAWEVIAQNNLLGWGML